MNTRVPSSTPQNDPTTPWLTIWKNCSYRSLFGRIFYLLVDKDDIPFVMDQPEGNLDNHTIYKLLGECIREAKQRRQIIMVTHNPNLAVACDAEQIIGASLDQKDGHRVRYVSGAIENPDINRMVLDVLEGTRPAFDNREAKYFADEIGLPTMR